MSTATSVLFGISSLSPQLDGKHSQVEAGDGTGLILAGVLVLVVIGLLLGSILLKRRRSRDTDPAGSR